MINISAIAQKNESSLLLDQPTLHVNVSTCFQWDECNIYQMLGRVSLYKSWAQVGETGLNGDWSEERQAGRSFDWCGHLWPMPLEEKLTQVNQFQVIGGWVLNPVQRGAERSGCWCESQGENTLWLSLYLQLSMFVSAVVATQQCFSGGREEVATRCPVLAHIRTGTPGSQPRRVGSDRFAGRRSVCCSPADTRGCGEWPWGEDCAASTQDCQMSFWALCRPWWSRSERDGGCASGGGCVQDGQSGGCGLRGWRCFVCLGREAVLWCGYWMPLVAWFGKGSGWWKFHCLLLLLLLLLPPLPCVPQGLHSSSKRRDTFPQSYGRCWGTTGHWHTHPPLWAARWRYCGNLARECEPLRFCDGWQTGSPPQGWDNLHEKRKELSEERRLAGWEHCGS